jgi:2-methylcitrate dehydratase PrpD
MGCADSAVVHQAKRALINFFAVALTGCCEPAIETALQSLTAFSGGRRATIIGRGERLDALSAAFLNAASANVLDFCDTHVPTVIHPTAPVAPSLFALGELRDVSGRDLILAFVLGAEIECRIGLAMSPSHYRRGWHITATCGVFGAAAGSGKILGLKAEPMGLCPRHRRDPGRRLVRMPRAIRSWPRAPTGRTSQPAANRK